MGLVMAHDIIDAGHHGFNQIQIQFLLHIPCSFFNDHQIFIVYDLTLDFTSYV